MPGRSDWTPQHAERVAARSKIGPLTDRHWKVIAACREEAARFGEMPTLERLQRLTSASPEELVRLFSHQPRVLMARIAGLGLPREESGP